MARDLALVEELAIDGTDDALLAEAVQRINEAARILKLTPDFPGDTALLLSLAEPESPPHVRRSRHDAQHPEAPQTQNTQRHLVDGPG